MDVLNIDIETYSSVDIKKAGLYKYARSTDFEILLFAYSLNGADVKVVDLAQGENIPLEIVAMLNDGVTELRAFNATFEWYCLNQAGFKTNIDQWKCTMILSYYAGYPGSLEKVGTALKFKKDNKKSTTGKALIKYFSMPCNPTKSNGQRTRNLPCHDLDKWNLYKEYNRQDVVAEMAILKTFEKIEVPKFEWDLWRTDVLMNERGIKIDVGLVDGALTISNIWNELLIEEAKNITKIENPNSATQLLKWLKDKEVDAENLQKETVKKLIKNVTGDVKRVLEIRQELSKTSTKKYVAMQEALCEDERVRGLLQFYGANRTGRWAGRLVQVQNLPRNYIEDLSTTRDLVKRVDLDTLEIIYDNIPDTLSQLIRTAFIPKKDHKFVIADFSAIEARVIAWLAGEQWRLDVFATHGKIYEASASQMFGVPIETIAKGHENYGLRQKGKVAELALGYQGGAGALTAMGALNMGLSEEELPGIVQMWRNANKRIVDLWYAVGNVATEVVLNGGALKTHGIIFERETFNMLSFLTVQLPSGRKLYYAEPGTRENSWGSTVITYKSNNQTSGKWEITDTYGGKLVENIVQAIARDCLAMSIYRLDYLGYEIVMHIHDEIVVEVPKSVTVEEVCAVMDREIDWAKGLILRADGFETEYYKKD